MSNSPAENSPYKGLQPYTERDRNFFFGRERDQQIITSNLFGSSLTVFYGASGVGKSSVLLAGVVPILRETPRVAVAVFRDWQDTSFETALKLKVLEAIRAEPQNSIDLNLELDEFLLSCMESFRGSLFIILDQFEEYFLYHPLSPGAEKFDAAFARAINRREIGANFLLAMRDDGLSRLDRFQKRIPNLMNNMLRLEHLDRSSAELAIRNPLTRYNLSRANGQPSVEIEDGLVTVLLDDLQTGRVTLDLTGQGKVSTGERSDKTTRIETPFLQVVLTRLWDEEHQSGKLAGQNTVTLKLETYMGLGGAKSIVRTHLDKTMETKRLVPYRDSAAALFHFLVTPTGMKIAHTVEDLTSYTKRPRIEIEKALNELSEPDVRILRPIAAPPGQPGLLRYEIFHDVLAPAILDWRARVVTQQAEAQAKAEAEENLARQRKEAEENLAQQRKEAERQAMAHRLDQATALAKAERQRAEAETLRARSEGLRATEQTRAAGKLRRMVAGLAVMIVLAGAATLFAIFNWRRANAETRIARAAEYNSKALTVKAEAESRRANQQATLATEREREATEAKAATLVALKNAEAERQRAEDQALIAQRERKRAEELQAYASSQRDLAIKAAEEAKLARDNEALYRQALALSRRVSTKEQAVPMLNKVADFFRAKHDDAALTAALLSLAAVHAELDYGSNAAAADESFNQALKLAANDSEKAVIRTRMADIYRELPAWLSSRPQDKAISLYREAYDEFEKLNDRANQAAVEVTVGMTLGDQAAASSPNEGNMQFIAALAHIEIALDIYKDLKDDRNVALALSHAGEIAQKGFSPEIRQLSYKYYTRSLETYRKLNDKKSEAFVLRRLVGLDEQAQRYDKALAGYREIVQLSRELNDPVREVGTIDELGFAFANQYANPNTPPSEKQALAKDAPGMIELLKNAISTSEAARNPGRRASMFTNLGRLYEERNELPSAVAAYKEGLAEYKRIPGSAPSQMYALEALTRVTATMKDLQQGKHFLEETARLIPEFQVPSQKLERALRLGFNALDVNEDKVASNAFDIAIDTSRKANQPIYATVSVANTLHRVGHEYSRRGRVEEAMPYLTEALQLFVKENQVYGQAAVSIAIAIGYAARKDHLKAIEHYERGLKLYQQMNYDIGKASTLRAISELYRAQGNSVEADKYQRQAEAIGSAGQPPGSTP